MRGLTTACPVNIEHPKRERGVPPDEHSGGHARSYGRSMRGSIPYLVAATLIRLAVWFAMSAPLHSIN